MKVGTKSVLYGAHCFLLHPVLVALAWIKLYGWTWDLRIWVAFFVHDLGYWGKPNMDGPEGETHPEAGARIMHFLFDGWETVRFTKLYVDESEYAAFIKDGWVCKRKRVSLNPIWKYEFLSFRKRVRKSTWHDFTLYHSRYYAKSKGAQPSKLCFADKLAFTYTNRFMCILMTSATGEIVEYMRHSEIYKNMPEPWKPDLVQKLMWYDVVCAHNSRWVEEHKDGKTDTWTENRHNPTQVLREETVANEF